MYPVIGDTFYDNIINLLETFTGVRLAQKIYAPENESEARHFLTHMLRVSTLGMLASKYVYMNNCGFEKSAPYYYKKLNLNSDHIKQCASTLFSVCCNPHYINLPKNYKVNKYDAASSSSTSARASSYSAKESSYQTAPSRESYSRNSSSQYSSSTRRAKDESSYSSSKPAASEIMSVLKSNEGKQLMAELIQSAQQQQALQMTQQQISHQQYYQYPSDQLEQSYYTTSYVQHQQAVSPSTPVRDECDYSSYSQNHYT